MINTAFDNSEWQLLAGAHAENDDADCYRQETPRTRLKNMTVLELA